MAESTEFILGKVEKRVLRLLIISGGTIRGINELCLQIYGKMNAELLEYTEEVVARLQKKGLVEAVDMADGSKLIKLTKRGIAEVLRRWRI